MAAEDMVVAEGCGVCDREIGCDARSSAPPYLDQKYSTTSILSTQCTFFATQWHILFRAITKTKGMHNISCTAQFYLHKPGYELSSWSERRQIFVSYA